MATKEELSEQLAVTQKLAAAVDQMARSMSRVESSFDNQISAVEKLTRAIEQLRGQDLNQLNSTKLDNLQKELKSTEKQVTGLSGRLKDIGTQMSKKFPTSVAIGAAALSGFAQGFRNVMAIGKGVTGFLSGLIDLVGSVAASIISIPFQIFDKLVSAAAAGAGGMNELAVAIEKIRKEFGDLKGPAAHTIIDTSKSLKGFSDTGLSAFRIFGNVAERLEHVTKIAQSMGPTFGLLTKEFQQNGGALLAFEKGLDGSGEGMKQVAERAIAMGKPMARVFLDMTKQTLALGKAFDIDQKLIGKDMVKALADVKHFGSITVKEIASASVYARKLGLELDKITGTLDAFETFDTAAENASKLSQSFGVTVDAFKLMEAQNPADQLDMLRKSMRAAGQSTETMTRQQLKLLAQTTGLDEATAKLAFSSKNQGVSLDDIKKKSGEAEKKTLTQAEAMSKLADSIERLVKSGGELPGGFFDAFLKGISRGIQSSVEFRSIILNIRRALMTVMMEGVRMGKALVEQFPGLKQFLGGIADFFRPEKFKALARGVTDTFIQWMKDLTDPNGKASFAGLMDKLRDKFFDFFNSQSSSGKKMLDGFKTILKTISRMISEAIKWIADKTVEGIKFVIDLLTGKVNLSVAGAAGGLGFLAEVLVPLGDALAHAWTVLKGPMIQLVMTLFEELKNLLMSDEVLGLIKPALPAIAAALFGPAFGRALLGALTATVVKGAASLFSGPANKLFGKIGEKVAEISSAPKAPKISEALPAASDSQKAAESGRALSKGGEGISWASVGKFLVGLAAVITLGMAAVLGAIALIDVLHITPKELAMGLATVAVASASMLPIAISLAIISKFPIGPQAILGIAAIGLAIMAMAGVLVLATDVLSSIEASKLKSVADILIDISKVFLLAGGVVLASVAIGVLVAGPQGLLALAGFAAITATVGAMSAAAINIMKQLNEVPMGAGFLDKVKAFTSIMDAITNFAKNLTQMLEAVKPSFISLIKGKDDTVERIDGLRKMLDSFIGKPGDGGLIGMIEKIVWAVKEMAGGDKKTLEAAKTFAEILSATGSLAAALKPPDKLFESIDGFWTTSGDVIKGIEKVSEYANNITAGVEKLINVFITKVMPIVQGAGGNGLSDQQIKGAAAVGQLLGSVTQIAQGLTPSATTLQNMRDVSSNIIAHGDDSSLDPKNMQALGDFTTKIADGLTKLLPTVIGSLKPVLDVIGTWHFTDSDAAAMKSIGPLLQQMFVMVQSLTAQSAQLASAKVPGVDVEKFIDKIGEVMPGIFKSMADKLPDLFTALKNGIMNMRVGLKPEVLKQGVDVFKNIVSVLAEIPKLTQEISGIGDVKGEGNAATKVYDAATFLRDITQGDKAGIPIMAEAAVNLSTYARALKTNGIIPALEAVTKMVKLANELDATLNDGMKINTPIKLGQLASAVGLGGKHSYTISNKDVNVTVNLSVTMDVGEVEKVMIMRGKSIIRDRLQFATVTNVNDTASTSIPETYTPGWNVPATP